MIATDELYVACRRPIAIGTLPAGIRCTELPPIGWQFLRHALPFSEQPAQVLELHRERDDESLLWALAKACADAGGGVVLSVMPVTAPPRCELRHDGSSAAPTDWTGILAGARAYKEAERQAEAAERRRRDAERASWKPDPRADFSDLFKNQKR